MARKRLIDTEELYFDTEIIGLLGPKGLHLYIRLWGLAEDWGGYEPRYSDIAYRMGAMRFTPKEVEAAIQKLVKAKKVLEYEVGGKKYHWIVNLMKHQKLNNSTPPVLPPPEWIAYEVKDYDSGKRYAKYLIVTEKLPVGYQNTTSRLPLDYPSEERKQNRNRIERKQNRNRIERKQNRNRIETDTVTIDLESQWYKDLTADYPNLNINDEYQRFIKWEKDNPRKNHKKAFRNWLNNSDKWQKEKGPHGRPKGDARQDHGPDKFAGIGKEVDPVPQV